MVLKEEEAPCLTRFSDLLGDGELGVWVVDAGNVDDWEVLGRHIVGYREPFKCLQSPYR
jgi:hypothetical protein